MASVDYRKLEDGDNTAAGPLAPPFQLAQLDNDKEGLLKGLNDAQVAELVKKCLGRSQKLVVGFLARQMITFLRLSTFEFRNKCFQIENINNSKVVDSFTDLCVHFLLGNVMPHLFEMRWGLLI